MTKGIVRGCCLVAILGAVTSCISIPSSDTMVPELSLSYQVNDGPWTDLAVGDEISIVKADEVRFMAAATDAGGVREVAIRAEGYSHWHKITDPSRVEMKYPSYSAVNGSEPDLGPGDTAPTIQTVSWRYSARVTEIDDGYTFRDAVLTVTATAEDFTGNSTSSGEMTLRVE